MITEPLVSEIAVNPLWWTAAIIDSNGQVPDAQDVDENQWVHEMRCAARLLARLPNQPRMMVIIHPAGYGHHQWD